MQLEKRVERLETQESSGCLFLLIVASVLFGLALLGSVAARIGKIESRLEKVEFQPYVVPVKKSQ